MLRRRASALAIAALLAAPASAYAGDDEVRVRGSCGAGARSELRLRAKDGEIETEFRVDRARRGTWRVILVHERHVAWRGSVRTTGSIRVRQTVGDYSGADHVMYRATGPRGLTCAASATLSGTN
jgi:hypothetical protein